MNVKNNLFSGAAKTAGALLIGATLMISCSKGTSCPAYAGAKKYQKKNASWAMMEKNDSNKHI